MLRSSLENPKLQSLPRLPKMTLGRAALVAFSAFLGTGSGCGKPPADDCKKPLAERVATNNPPGIDVSVDLAQPYQSEMRWGPLHGMEYREPVDRAYADAASARLDALNPRNWRVGGTKDPGGGGSGYGAFHPFVTDYRYPARFGTLVTFNLQDIFQAAHGKPLKVTAICDSRRSCWNSFEALRRDWNAELSTWLTGTGTNHCSDPNIDYFELAAEPDFNSFKGLTLEQNYLLMLDLYRLVKQCKPSARFVGPATVEWNQEFMQGLFAFMSKNDMHLDAVSWHEFGSDALPKYSAQAVTEHVAACKALFEQYPAVCQGGCPEIHLNEYQPPETAFISGHAVSWLAALEGAGVASINPACWGAKFGGKDVSTCWNDFNGLLMPAPSTEPQPLYWTYKYFNALGRSRFKTETAPAELSTISGQLADGSVGILLGNGGIKRAKVGSKCQYSGVDRLSPTAIAVSHFPAGKTSAQVTYFQVTSNTAGGTGLGLEALNAYGVSQPTESMVSSAVQPISQGTLELSLPKCLAGDAWWIVIK